MTKKERARIAPALVAMAKDAAAVVLRVYEKPFRVHYKSKDDPVTAADRESNALICRALGERFPGIPIVAEESDPSTYAGYTRAKAAWFVDPLDGTRDFVKHNGEFAVMIGLAEKGRATLGVIVLPVTGQAYVGGEGVEAVAMEASGATVGIHVSKTRSFADAELVVSRSRVERYLEQAAKRFGVRKLTPCGSAGLKGVRVACGEADVYMQPFRGGKLWDACAPEAIVTAAGGRVSNGLGEAIDYRSKEIELTTGFLASNAALHAAVVERSRRLLEESTRPTE